MKTKTFSGVTSPHANVGKVSEVNYGVSCLLPYRLSGVNAPVPSWLTHTHTHTPALGFTHTACGTTITARCCDFLSDNSFHKYLWRSDADGAIWGRQMYISVCVCVLGICRWQCVKRTHMRSDRVETNSQPGLRTPSRIMWDIFSHTI